MKAVILAAGKAPRLLPLTKDIPQCMLKVKDKTILEHQVESLRRIGIKDIFVISGYMSIKVEKLSNKLGIKTSMSLFSVTSPLAILPYTLGER